MFLSLLTSLKRLLRPTPSVREAHRRYLLHLRDNGSCDFVAAGLTVVEYSALKWVLNHTPKAEEQTYDVATALNEWPSNHQLGGCVPPEILDVHDQIFQLLERWEKQEEAAKYRLNMPPGVQHPFFGSTTGYTQMF